MATINQRTFAGGTTRYWVKWRLSGTRDGAPQSQPFDNHADAHTFRLHVESAGHQWPENWIPRQGWTEGWVPGQDWLKTEEEPEAEPVPFADFAREYIDFLSGIDERTRADYRRDLSGEDSAPARCSQPRAGAPSFFWSSSLCGAEGVSGSGSYATRNCASHPSHTKGINHS